MTSTWNVFKNNTSLEIAVFSISGTFTLCAVIMTGYLAFRHLKHWTDPEGQRAILRILALVPIYSVVSLLAIGFGDYALYFVLVRDCYEAYALYQFFCLMIHYLQKAFAEDTTNHFICSNGGLLETGDIGHMLGYYGETRMSFPCCMLTYQPGNRSYLYIKRCSLQYVFIKPLLSCIAILLQLLDLYRPGSLSIKYGYFWLTMILNISAAVAIYFILLFYELTKKTIQEYRPLAKLISIKILVFVIFWQSVIITVFYYFHIIPAFFSWSIERSSDTVQNMLICTEMMFLSFFNLYAFSYVSHRTLPGEHTLEFALKNISTIVNQSDMIQETKEALNFKSGKDDKHKD